MRACPSRMRAVKAAGSRRSSRSKLFRIKVISMGDTCVGKSCLIKRWVRRRARTHTRWWSQSDRDATQPGHEARLCVCEVCSRLHQAPGTNAFAARGCRVRARGLCVWPRRYCEEKFVSKYIPTIGVDYGVKPVKFGDYEVGACLCGDGGGAAWRCTSGTRWHLWSA